jgi:hypothetical protein
VQGLDVQSDRAKNRRNIWRGEHEDNMRQKKQGEQKLV